MVRAALVLASLAACRTPVDPRVDAPRGEPTVAYGELLARVVTDDGLVDYDMLEAERGPLDRYVAWLGKPRRVARANIRHAFWLNAYNALVLRGAAEQRAGNPEFSPQDDDFAFFTIRQHLVAGTVLSLDAIEHGIVRGDFSHASFTTLSAADQAVIRTLSADVLDAPDGRVHVALNCAARSCPALPSRAFRAGDLDATLDERARLFVADPTRGAGPNGISTLFQWFSADFESSHGSSRGFIESYRDDVSNVDFGTFLAYDWTLNAQ